MRQLIKFFWHSSWLISGIKANKMSKPLTGKMFKKKVLESLQLTVVQFKANWNGACQIISPVYEELSNAYAGNAVFFIIDIDKNKTIAKEYGITELPAILFFFNGQVIDHVMGLVPKDVLVTKIENALSLK